MFHTDLDPSGLERGIKSSKKSIDVWITESIIRINKLQDEVKKLSESIDMASKDKGAPTKMYEEWKAKTAELNAETEKLLDLQDEQVRANELTEDSQQGVIASLIEWGKRLGIVAVATEFLKQVKTGKLEFAKVSNELERLVDEIEMLSKNSVLPEHVDTEYWDKWLLSVYAREFNLNV